VKTKNFFRRVKNDLPFSLADRNTHFLAQKWLQFDRKNMQIDLQVFFEETPPKPDQENSD